MKRLLPILLLTWLALSSLHAQDTSSASEWAKLRYTLHTDVVASTGQHTPFWLVSNRHGRSSLTQGNGQLSVGLFRDFDTSRRFTWAYGAELTAAYHHLAPRYIHQLYADLKYGCWELSLGSKERWSEGKHRTLSGGGLTFAPNARPIPQVRFGITDYAIVPWLFDGWVQVKGHLSYGRYTDKPFLLSHMTDAPRNTHYTLDILFHEKTAFLKIGNESKHPLSAEIGLEMYSQFGGTFMIKRPGMADSVRHRIPHTYKEYLKALIPMEGGSDAPASDQQNINGNVFGSWHLAATYRASSWHLRLYYEHFYEDHSGLLGYHKPSHTIAYFPWHDGLYAFELTLPHSPLVRTVVYEFITSRMQSGPILKYGEDPMVGKDSFYNNSIYQSWQHWGMAVCNPHHLSPLYAERPTQRMSHTRLRSHHIGLGGSPTPQTDYRLLCSWTRHWGTYDDPLPEPQTQLSLMAELSYAPTTWSGWQLTGAIALDRSPLIGNNTGAMLTLRHQSISL